MNIVAGLEQKGIGFESISETIETTSAAGKLLFHVFAALAEFERNLIRERTRAGLVAARARGRSGGRKPELDARQIREIKRLMSDPTIPVGQSAERYKVSRTTIYKVVRRAIETGDFFVLDGLTLYVAEVGEPLKTTAGEVDRRLRLIFSNGTESNLLLRSLQRAFYNDPAARRLTSPESGQLSFGGELEADDVESGTIYVLRSLSDHPYVAQHRDVMHKVGVTGGSVWCVFTSTGFG